MPWVLVDFGLSASKAVDYAICKARRNLFSYGVMGVFKGKLNSNHSRKVIYVTCVILMLLHVWQ